MQILNERYDAAVPVSSLYLHPQNPREGNVGLITKSIETVGWYGAIIAQVSTRRILAGNHRYRSALESEAADVPVIWVDVDDETALKIMLVDNKASDEASNNEAALIDLLKGIVAETGTLDGTGYSGDDLDDLIASLLSAGGPPPEEPIPASPAPDDTRKQYAYTVMVICASEVEQEATFTKLQQEGYSCKVVNT